MAYGSDLGFTSYVTERGYTVPAGSIPAARERGSMYIDALYGPRFSGTPIDGIEQINAFPRENSEDIWGNEVIGIPTRVIYASYESALLELANPGSLAILTSENERIKSIKAGSVAITYADATAYSTISGAYPMFTTIEGLLYPLLGTSSELSLPAILVV